MSKRKAEAVEEEEEEDTMPDPIEADVMDTKCWLLRVPNDLAERVSFNSVSLSLPPCLCLSVSRSLCLLMASVSFSSLFGFSFSLPDSCFKGRV